MFKIVASQFVDRPVQGDAPITVRYSGRVDGYIDISGGVFGGDDSLTLTVRPEYTWARIPMVRLA
jgi:porin